jgi:hypothetical protein
LTLQHAAGDSFAERRASVLSKLVLLFAQGMAPEAVAETSVHLAGEATGASAVFVYLWDSDEERLVLRVATPGPQREGVGEVRLRLGDGIAGWAALRQEPVIISHAPRLDPRYRGIDSIGEDEFNSMLAVPIVDDRGQLRGVFALYSTEEAAFGPDELALAVEVGQLLGVGLVHAATVVALNQQSTNARFLLDFPLGSTTSLVPALQYSARKVLDICAADVSILNYVSKQERSNPPTTFGLRQGEGQDHRVLSSHSPAAVQSTSEQHGVGLERTTVPLGMNSTRGALTLFRRAPFRAADLDHIRAVTAQLSVLLEAVDLASSGSSHVTALLFESSNARTARILEGLDVVGPTYPCTFRVLDLQGNLDESRSRMKELFSAAAGPNSIVLADSTSGVLIADASRGRTSNELASQLRHAAQQLSSELDAKVAVGVGPISPEPSTFRASMDLAGTALRWACMVSHEETPVIDYAEIEDVTLLPEVWKDLSGDVVALARRLAPLIAYDRLHGSELTRSLSAFARFGGSASATAALLVIHRNTLRQRIQRIDQLSGMNIAATTDWLSLAVAAALAESRIAPPTRPRPNA